MIAIPLVFLALLTIAMVRGIHTAMHTPAVKRNPYTGFSEY